MNIEDRTWRGEEATVALELVSDKKVVNQSNIFGKGVEKVKIEKKARVPLMTTKGFNYCVFDLLELHDFGLGEKPVVYSKPYRSGRRGFFYRVGSKKIRSFDKSFDSGDIVFGVEGSKEKTAVRRVPSTDAHKLSNHLILVGLHGA